MTYEQKASKRSFSQKIALAACGIILSLGLGVGILPSLLSTPAGTRWLCKQISKKTGIELQVKKLSINWLGSQELIDIEGTKKQEGISFYCPQIFTEASLWKILIAHDIENLSVKNPQLVLSKSFHPSATFKQPLFQAAGLNPDFQIGLASLDLSWKGTIELSEGKLQFETPDFDRLEFEQADLSLKLMKRRGIEGTFKCLTFQSEKQGSLSCFGALSEQSYTLNALVKDLPTRGIDQLIGVLYPHYSGLFYQLIGPTLDLTCSLHNNADSTQIDLQALSPLFKADLTAQSLNGFLTLTKPAILEWQLTPQLISQAERIFPILNPLTLTKQTTLKATIGQWNSPLPFKAKSIEDISFQAELMLTEQTQGTIHSTPFTLNSFSLAANASSLKEHASGKGSCEIILDNQTGTLEIEGQLVNPLLNNKQGKLSLITKQFPLIFCNTEDLNLTTLIGKTADINGFLNLNEQAPRLQLSINTPLFQLSAFDLSLKGPWKLVAPTTFSFNPSKALSDRMGISSTPLSGTIQRFELPANNWQGLQLETILECKTLTFQEPLHQTLSECQATLLAQTLNKISLHVKTDELDAAIEGQLNTKNNTFSLVQPLTIQYGLTLPQLAKKTNVQLSIDPFTTSLKDPLTGGIKGQIFCAEALLIPADPPIILQNTVVPFQWDEKAQRISLQVSSQAKGEEKKIGSIQGQLICAPHQGEKKLDFNTASLQGSLKLTNLSSELIDTLLQRPYLSLLLGNTFNAELKLNSSFTEQNLSIKWASPNLNFDSAFFVNEQGIRLNADSAINWNLTSEGYRIIDRLITKERQSAFGLNAPSLFTLTVSKLFLPLTPSQEIKAFTDRFASLNMDLTGLELIVSGSNPNLIFFEKASKEQISFSNFSGSIHKISGETPFTVMLDSTVSTQSGQAAKSGSLSFSSRLDLPSSPQQTTDLSNLNATISLQAKQFPSKVLDLIARTSGQTDFPFTTLFGPVLHLSLNTDLKHFSGPLEFKLNTPTTQAELKGHFINGSLLLDRPFSSQIAVTKESSQLLLKEINPLDLSYIYSHTPITLNIPAEGFFLPIYPFIPEKMTVPNASIELGKVACRNEGNVNITLGLLKSKQFNKDQDLTLWFAPIDLSIKQGMIDLERTEILISDTFDICTWGKIDLVKEYVDMTLGLTAQTLGAAFGIKNLPENYVLTIPMKGKMDNVQINTGKATAKVALLLAWQNKSLSKAFGDSPFGAAAGELLGALATLPDANAKIPPPKQPFPWERGAEKRLQSRSKKKTFKTSDKPLKQILKVIR